MTSILLFCLGSGFVWDRVLSGAGLRWLLRLGGQICRLAEFYFPVSDIVLARRFELEPDALNIIVPTPACPKTWVVLGLLVNLGSLSSCTHGFAPGFAPASPPPPKQLQYEVRSLPSSTVHLLRIPERYRIRVAIAPQVETVERFAQSQGAIAAINAGFFDAANAQSTSFVGINGHVVADPRKNSRLMQNPALEPYHEAIVNRSEFRRYQCGGVNRYDILYRAAPVPSGCTWVDLVGGGPRLLPELTATQEGFWDPKHHRDPLGHDQPNARTAIALTRDGEVLWVMVAQKTGSTQPSDPGGLSPSRGGLSLPELADFLRTENIKQALNLDGGSSAGLYYQGKMVYGKRDERDRPVARAVKSALLLFPPAPGE